MVTPPLAELDDAALDAYIERLRAECRADSSQPIDELQQALQEQVLRAFRHRPAGADVYTHITERERAEDADGDEPTNEYGG